MIIKSRRKFLKGTIGLVTFSVAFCLWVFPVTGNRTGVQFADDLFNQFSKNSAYHIPSALKMAQKFKGVAIDISFNPRWPGADRSLTKIIEAQGMSAYPVGDGRVRIKGDLGLLGIAAATDADLLFKGNEKTLEGKYGLPGKDVIYYWWTAFDDLVRRYVQLNRVSEADFTKFMTTRVLEPSYNFAGIIPRKVMEKAGMISFLLLTYLSYTLWYGFSILFLFEGLGISATKPTLKKEA
jgi:hypothetical protein